MFLSGLSTEMDGHSKLFPSAERANLATIGGYRDALWRHTAGTIEEKEKEEEENYSSQPPRTHSSNTSVSLHYS